MQTSPEKIENSAGGNGELINFIIKAKDEIIQTKDEENVLVLKAKDDTIQAKDEIIEKDNVLIVELRQDRVVNPIQ
jgi:hypothetical protein